MKIEPNMRVLVDYEIHLDEKESADLRTFLLSHSTGCPIAMQLLDKLTEARTCYHRRLSDFHDKTDKEAVNGNS